MISKKTHFATIIVLAAMLLALATVPAQLDQDTVHDTNQTYNTSATINSTVANSTETSSHAHNVSSPDADLINGTGNYSDGLTGTEIKRSIQDFVAASEEPVTADDIVSFVNGNVLGVGAGEISFGSESVFNPATTYDTSVSALNATHFVVAYQDYGNSDNGTAVIGSVSAQEPTFNCTCGDICVNTSGWWRNGGDYHPLVTPGFTAPNITSYAPDTTVSSDEGATRVFNVTVNQTVNATWYINGSVDQQNNTASTEVAYTNTSAVAGCWNVSVVVNNTSGTDMQTWLWTVNAGQPGAPNITSWDNNKTNNDSTTITINESESVRFNATANQTITIWNWHNNATLVQSNNFDNYTTSWSVNGTHRFIKRNEYERHIEPGYMDDQRNRHHSTGTGQGSDKRHNNRNYG